MLGYISEAMDFNGLCAPFWNGAQGKEGKQFLF